MSIGETTTLYRTAIGALQKRHAKFTKGLQSTGTRAAPQPGTPYGREPMPSENVGSKRKTGNDPEVPAELSEREAQDRSTGEQAKSPVDSMHVDAPKKQDNARGHKQSKDR